MSVRSLKSFVKSAAMAVAPQVTAQWLAQRSLRFIIQSEVNRGVIADTRSVVGRYGASVLRGPFEGLQYPRDTAHSRNVLPKLVGSYEREIQGWIEGVVPRAHPMIVNVGCADGYYAVGLARRFPEAKVIAFDTSSWARSATASMAALNGAANIELLAMCTSAWLASHLEAKSLLVLDCEGCEVRLLDPGPAPILLQCDFIVELHEQEVPGLYDQLSKWYGGTHDITHAWAVPRTESVGEYPELDVIQVSRRAEALNEGRRYPQRWARLLRKT